MSARILLILAASLFGCATMPPPMMPIDGALRAPLGTTSARPYGLVSSVGGGGGLRVTHQLGRDLTIGGEGLWVMNGFGPGSWEKLDHAYVGRGHVRYNITDGLGLIAGLGGAAGVNSYEGYPLWKKSFLGDMGVVVGGRLGERMESCVGMSLGMNVPLTEPGFSAYVYWAISIGTNIRLTDRLRLGLDASTSLSQITVREREAKMTPFFSFATGTLSVAYAFGGSAR